ncbi:MAG: FAD assembly factor SdhE [Gammaproteobacteria bacterium]
MRAYEKLKWRCRRGVVELDILLLRYLENRYLGTERDEQDRFADLLSWEDDELLAVLLGGKAPEDHRFDALIASIRSRTEASPSH